MNRISCLLIAALALAGASPTLVHGAQAAKAPAPTVVVTDEVVNLNTATAAQFASLPGIGPKTADLIVDYRTKNGPFKKIEEIMNVRGIGEKSFLKLKARLTITPAKS